MSEVTFSFSALDSSIHDRKAFSSGNENLDYYFKNQASQDVRRGVATCFVATDSQGTVAGFYTLSMYSVSVKDLPKETIRNLPKYPYIPACLIGRLAVDQAFRGQKLGKAMLADAMVRTIEAQQSVGTFAMVVDAIDDKAVLFYQHHGFLNYGCDPYKLFLPLETFKKAYS